jgi:hypothetical protein
MTEGQREIIYEAECGVCHEHRTHLGNLISCVKGVFESQYVQDVSLSDTLRIELAKTMYEQLCLDARTRMIQGYKTTNIKAINK